MAGRTKDKNLDTRAARKELKPRRKPYYRSIGSGLHIGYRKGKTVGVWCVRFYKGDGNYEVTTLAHADDKLDANGTTILDFWQAQIVVRDFHRKLTAGEPTKPHTVKEAIGDYIDWLKSHRKSGQDAEYRANALIVPELGKIEVSKLTAKQIRDWMQKIASTPPRARTKSGQEQRFRTIKEDATADEQLEDLRKRRAATNRVLTTLKAALNFAFREGKVSSDAEWKRVEAFKKADVARIHFLEIPEAQRLVNTAEHSFRNLLRGALETGARYSELATLRVNDFNSDVGKVHVRESKSGKDRHVVLSAAGVQFFKTLTAGRDGSELMFVKADGEAWGKNHQSRLMAEACARAKISPPVGFHQLRHTWASHAVMNGVPLILVAKNLGHADTRMVEKHYAHMLETYETDMIRAGAPTFGFATETNVVGIGG